MKSFFALAAVAVVSSAANPHCVEKNYIAVANSSQLSPFFSQCAKDADITEAQLAAKVIPSQEQGNKFTNSNNCQSFFKDIQNISTQQHCIELNVVQNVTWSMVVSAVNVAVYPQVTTPCDFGAIQKAAAGLAFKWSFYRCIPSSGINLANLKEIPPVEKLEAVRKNSNCKDLYGEVQKLIKGFPHCALYKPDNATTTPGLDIHAFETLSFDSAIDILELGSTFQNQFVGPTTLVAQTPAPNMPVVVGLSMMAGAAVALVAVYVYQKRAARQEYATIL